MIFITSTSASTHSFIPQQQLSVSVHSYSSQLRFTAHSFSSSWFFSSQLRLAHSLTLSLGFQFTVSTHNSISQLQFTPCNSSVTRYYNRFHLLSKPVSFYARIGFNVSACTDLLTYASVSFSSSFSACLCFTVSQLMLLPTLSIGWRIEFSISRSPRSRCGPRPQSRAERPTSTDSYTTAHVHRFVQHYGPRHSLVHCGPRERSVSANENCSTPTSASAQALAFVSPSSSASPVRTSVSLRLSLSRVCQPAVVGGSLTRHTFGLRLDPLD